MLVTENTPQSVVRRSFPTLDEMTYLNVATHGLTAMPVLERYKELVTRASTYGHKAYEEEEVPAYRAAREAVAGILGVPTTWVAFSRNATDSINYVFGSLAWQPGDEVIISDQEHPAVLYPWEYGTRRGLFTGKTFCIDRDPAVTLSNLEQQITPRTRLIAFSHVSSQTGIRVPAKAIHALVENLNDGHRTRPILTLVDGTQEVGQWRVSVPQLGCDFYVSNGHKWLGGPRASGILVVRERSFSLLTPPYMAGGIDDRGDGIADMLSHRAASHLFEAGTQNLAVISVLVDAIGWLENLGWSWVEERERALAEYLRAQLRKVPGVSVLTPDEWELSSAITSFSVKDADAQHMHSALWQQSIITRHVPELNAIRISTPYFCTEEDVDTLLEATCRVLASRHPAA